MGFPMAAHLSKKYSNIAVYNRTKHKAETWSAKNSGYPTSTPALAAKKADVIFTCLGADIDAWEVICSGQNSIIQEARVGSIVVDHSSISSTMAKRIAATLIEKGIEFIDAPVSGGQSGAETGELTIMCGGKKEVFDDIRPILDCYSKKAELIGPIGSGQLCKMVNQICVAGVIQGLAEGLHFAEKAGLDLQKVFSSIEAGAASSWQMSNRHQTMISGSYDFGFAVDWMRKDLNNCLQEAANIGANLPLTALIDQFYASVQLMGGGRWDTSALIEPLRKSRKVDSTS